MNRTSFFRGLSIGLLVSFFLWSGIIFGISSIMQEDTIQQQMDNTADPVDRNDNSKTSIRNLAELELKKEK